MSADLNVGWHPVNGGDYFSYRNGTKWTRTWTRPQARPVVSKPTADSNTFGLVFGAILAAVVAVVLVGVVVYFVQQDRIDREGDRVMRVAVCRLDSTTRC